MYKYLLLFFLSFQSFAGEYHQFFSTEKFSESDMMCYSLAMIGFDSTINARAGVAPESVFRLAQNSISGTNLDDKDVVLFTTVLGAYLWKDSPHSYAIRTFFKCSKDS